MRPVKVGVRTRDESLACPAYFIVSGHDVRATGLASIPGVVIQLSHAAAALAGRDSGEPIFETVPSTALQLAVLTVVLIACKDRAAIEREGSAAA